MKKVQATSKTSKTVFSLFAALMALMLMAAPALAHHSGGHDKGVTSADEDKGAKAPAKGAKAPAKGDRDGDADRDPSTTYTEDNDHNDGGTKNNVSDDGDNRHPSGKDRSVEAGKSSSNPNQGKSESDPDDDGRGPDRTNGGPDKPNGSGGVDKADQDGNNGCGNDDDFEDDNEGWCGKPAKDDSVKGNETEKPCDADLTMPGTQPCVVVVPDTDTDAPDVDEDEVLPGNFKNPDFGVDEDTAAPAAEERAPRVLGAVLPFTGASILSFLAASFALIAGGFAFTRIRRS